LDKKDKRRGENNTKRQALENALLLRGIKVLEMLCVLSFYHCDLCVPGSMKPLENDPSLGVLCIESTKSAYIQGKLWLYTFNLDSSDAINIMMGR
jgi:hypothetical protein